jgi:hypothetical protein
MESATADGIRGLRPNPVFASRRDAVNPLFQPGHVYETSNSCLQPGPAIKISKCRNRVACFFFS